MNCAVLTYKSATGWHFSEFIFGINCFYFRSFKHKITYKNREENSFWLASGHIFPVTVNQRKDKTSLLTNSTTPHSSEIASESPILGTN